MVGIIPKPIKKAPKWHNIATYAAFGLVIAVVLGYAGLIYLENKALNAIWDTEEKITKVGTKEERNMEIQVLLNSDKMGKFSTLFQDHKKSSKFFAFLEENSHPKVWITRLDLNTNEAEATLTGQTPNFQTLGEQLLIFQKEEVVKSISISSLSIGKDGKTGFILSLSLDPNLIK